jgi:hypothetical protein
MPDSALHILGTAQAEGTGIARLGASLAQGLRPKSYSVHACFLGPPGPLVAMLEAAGAHSVALDLPPGRNLSGMWRFGTNSTATDFRSSIPIRTAPR